MENPLEEGNREVAAFLGMNLESVMISVHEVVLAVLPDHVEHLAVNVRHREIRCAVENGGRAERIWRWKP